MGTKIIKELITISLLIKSKLENEIICPIGKKITQFLDDKNFLEKVINEGSEKANKIAQKNLKEIKNTVGFL